MRRSPIDELGVWSALIFDRMTFDAPPELDGPLAETAIMTIIPTLAFHWLGAVNDNDNRPVAGG